MALGALRFTWEFNIQLESKVRRLRLSPPLCVLSLESPDKNTPSKTEAPFFSSKGMGRKVIIVYVHLSVSPNLSIYLSVCLSVCLSIYLFPFSWTEKHQQLKPQKPPPPGRERPPLEFAQLILFGARAANRFPNSLGPIPLGLGSMPKVGSLVTFFS